jgi:gamma-butyrobetaine dioxygenase
MKIELVENKVYFISDSGKKEIHPFWLRERVNGEEFLDKNTQQRLFDPTSLNSDIAISKANISDDCLVINFNDGVNSKLNIEKIALEFSNEDNVIKSIDKIKWNSDLKNIKNFEYQDNLLIAKKCMIYLFLFTSMGL